MNKMRLAAEMRRVGFSQGQLAEAAGVNKSTLNRKINGHGSFTIQEAEAVCRALGIQDGKVKSQIFLTQSS